MYESSSSQFLKTNTRIQSGPGTFHKSRFITILRVTEILCSFRLERKAGRGIPESLRSEFLGNILAILFYQLLKTPLGC